MVAFRCGKAHEWIESQGSTFRASGNKRLYDRCKRNGTWVTSVGYHDIYGRSEGLNRYGCSNIFVILHRGCMWEGRGANMTACRNLSGLEEDEVTVVTGVAELAGAIEVVRLKELSSCKICTHETMLTREDRRVEPIEQMRHAELAEAVETVCYMRLSVSRSVEATMDMAIMMAVILLLASMSA